MVGWIEKDALKFAGDLNDQDIANIDAMTADYLKIEPDLEHIESVEQAEWARIQRVMPVILKWFPVILTIGKKIAAKQRSLT